MYSGIVDYLQMVCGKQAAPSVSFTCHVVRGDATNSNVYRASKVFASDTWNVGCIPLGQSPIEYSLVACPDVYAVSESCTALQTEHEWDQRLQRCGLWTWRTLEDALRD
eukprot:3269932-Pyramimonas_sp.AAC.1